jgi:hypothetical protein
MTLEDAIELVCTDIEVFNYHANTNPTKAAPAYVYQKWMLTLAKRWGYRPDPIVLKGVVHLHYLSMCIQPAAYIQIAGDSATRSGLVKAVLHFVTCKGNLGVTVPQLRRDDSRKGTRPSSYSTDDLAQKLADSPLRLHVMIPGAVALGQTLADFAQDEADFIDWKEFVRIATEEYQVHASVGVVQLRRKHLLQNAFYRVTGKALPIAGQCSYSKPLLKAVVFALKDTELRDMINVRLIAHPAFHGWLDVAAIEQYKG